MLNPLTFTLSSSVCPSTSKSPLASIFPVNVETPDTDRVVHVAPAPRNSTPPENVESPVKVDIPVTKRC